LESKGVHAGDKADLECLGRAEERQAQERGVPWFKFAEDEAMMKAIEDQKVKG
jgi:hypothetical protein